MPFSKLQIVFAQLNLSVGDIEGNSQKIIESIHAANNNHKADIILFPELSICSYPPEDLLLRPAFHKYIQQALTKICHETKDVHVLVGYPIKQDDIIYNACSLIYNGEIKLTYYKQHLPNYGVFDEKRYFTAGNKTCLFEINGIKAAISICEDIWVPGPAHDAAKAGARVLFNINASPYHKDKLLEREKIISKRAVETEMFIAYSNLVGGQDELIFDGNSMIVGNDGKIIFHAPQFEEGLFSFELNLDETDISGSTINYPSNEESIYNALVLGVKDYVRKNNFSGVVIGLSGGIDSALTTSIAVDALGPDNVEVLIMPSRYTADMSNNDAIEQANILNIKYEVISIELAFKAFLDLLENRFKNLPTDLTEENIQARCRGTLLMAVSNKCGKLVLTTGNKSEMAVGYATLYGDMAGGFAPLKDIWKTLAYKLAKWRNTKSRVIPENIINRPPTAELRHNQLDQDSLPDYEILDPILERYIEKDIPPEKIIAQGYDKDIVEKIVRLVDKNEYKRRQAAPGVRITERAFGRDRRYPISSGYIEK